MYTLWKLGPLGMYYTEVLSREVVLYYFVLQIQKSWLTALLVQW